MAIVDSKAHAFLKRISHIPHEGTEGNVHTGATSYTWFDILQGNQLDFTRRPELSNHVSPKAGKSSRLNPKRVGAAWAERRKLELELEKRGEPLTHTFRANWLPNFVEFGNPGLERTLEKKPRWRIHCPTRKMFSQRITCHYSLTSAKKCRTVPTNFGQAEDEGTLANIMLVVSP